MTARPLATLALAVLLAGCGPTPPPAKPVDTTLDLYNATARLEFDQGRPAEAAASYATALDRARQMDDPAAVTTAAYDLAIARAASGDSAAALAALDEAQHEIGRTPLDPTDLLLVRARVELLNGDPAAASRAADAVLAEPRATVPRRAQAHVMKGLAACRLNDAAGATRELHQAQASSADNGLPVAAMVAGLSGEVSLLAHDAAAAAAAFDRQAELSRASADYRTLCRALAKAGRAYAAAGRADVAADRLYRAARAAVAGGDRDAARLVVAAVAAARAAGDASLVRLAERLASQLGATTRAVP